jgi:hypothetical protein
MTKYSWKLAPATPFAPAIARKNDRRAYRAATRITPATAASLNAQASLGRLRFVRKGGVR